MYEVFVKYFVTAIRILYCNKLIGKETPIDEHVTSCTRIPCWGAFEVDIILG